MATVTLWGGARWAQRAGVHVGVSQPASGREGALGVALVRNVRCTLLKDGVVQGEVDLKSRDERSGGGLVRRPNLCGWR